MDARQSDIAFARAAEAIRRDASAQRTLGAIAAQGMP